MGDIGSVTTSTQVNQTNMWTPPPSTAKDVYFADVANASIQDGGNLGGDTAALQRIADKDHKTLDQVKADAANNDHSYKTDQSGFEAYAKGLNERVMFDMTGEDPFKSPPNNNNSAQSMMEPDRPTEGIHPGGA